MPSSSPVTVQKQWTLIKSGPFYGRMTNINNGVMFATIATSLPASTTIGVPVGPSMPVMLGPGENLYTRVFEYPSDVQMDEEMILIASPPLSLVTDSGGLYQRLRVDVDQTSFFQGKQYRSFRELNLAAGATRIIKNVVAVNTVLYDLSLTLDSGSIRLSVVSGGTEGGSFSEVMPIIRKNTMTDAPNVPSQNVCTTGGTLTGGTVIDISRVVSPGATAQQISVGSKAFDQRGVMPGTYYWKLENIGTAAATGVISFFWEER